MALTGNETLQISGTDSLGRSSGITYTTTTQAVADLAQQLSPNINYFFHGFTGNQIIGDPVFYDGSGALNNGAFGANLSNSAAWTNAGYVTTITPVSGSTDSTIHMPALNFDFQGGEKLIIWWLGIAATPGSTTSIMGDGFGTSYPGTRIRATSSGALDFALSSSATQAFIGASTGTPFDGTLHSFGIVLDGSAVKYGLWVDEVYDTTLSIAYATFNNGNAIDTRTTNTFNIGASPPASAVNTNGTSCKTRALAILRLPPGTPTPTSPSLTTLFSQLRANARKLISSEALS